MGYSGASADPSPSRRCDGARVVVIPAAGPLVVTGRAYRFDPGNRPSLLALGLRVLGTDAAPATLLNLDWRTGQPTCGG